MDTILNIYLIVILTMVGIGAVLKWRVWRANRHIKKAVTFAAEAEVAMTDGRDQEAGKLYSQSRAHYQRAQGILKPGA